MAGSFGFEKEHYEISMQIGAQRLFPAVNETDAVIVATGISCRQQIRHGTGKKAMHPAEVMWNAILRARQNGAGVKNGADGQNGK